MRLTPASKLKELRHWLNLSIDERESAGLPMTQELIAKHLNVSLTVVKYHAKRMKHSNEVKEAISASYDSKDWLTKRSKEVDVALLEACAKGNPQALRIYYMLTDRLNDDQGVNLHINANLIARAIFQAKRELARSGDVAESQGVDEVPVELSILPDNLHLPSGQDTTEDYPF